MKFWNLSRRKLLGSMGAVSAGMMLGAATKQAGPRALALIGDRYHNADYIRTSLNKVFGELSIPIDYTIDTSAISADLLRPYQLFLILRDGMLWPGGYAGPDAYVAYQTSLENREEWPAAKSVTWMTEAQGQAIKDFVNNGGGFYPMHNSSHISLGCKNYRDVMGGAYIGHPPLRPFEVHATANSHPITAGMQTFVVNDEQHYVAYDKDLKFVILESENRDGLQRHLKQQGVETLVHYPVPIPRQPALAREQPADCPVATRVCDRVLSLPLYPALEPDAIDRVVAAIRTFPMASASLPRT